MNVAELIEFLKTQDQAAIVQVLHSSDGRSCGEPYTAVSVTDFDPSLHVTLEDFTTNSQVKSESAWYMKKYLLLGLKDSY